MFGMGASRREASSRGCVLTSARAGARELIRNGGAGERGCEVVEGRFEALLLRARSAGCQLVRDQQADALGAGLEGYRGASIRAAGVGHARGEVVPRVALFLGGRGWLNRPRESAARDAGGLHTSPAALPPRRGCRPGEDDCTAAAREVGPRHAFASSLAGCAMNSGRAEADTFRVVRGARGHVFLAGSCRDLLMRRFGRHSLLPRTARLRRASRMLARLQDCQRGCVSAPDRVRRSSIASCCLALCTGFCRG